MAQKTLSLNALKAPVRPAPPPPSVIARASASHVQNGSAVPSRAPLRPSSEPKKKIAPPRPPPPKAISQLKAVQSAITFTGILQDTRKQSQLPLTSSVTAPDLLINWDSPPTSPTPGRSSSDGLSLKSFGSDSSGTTANGAFSTMTRSESGFESEPDAWSETAVSIPAPTQNEPTKPFTMPTIIRPIKPPPPTKPTSTHLKELEKIKSIPTPLFSQPRCSSPNLADLLDLDISAEYSPPEPSIPPPAPPSFLVTDATPPTLEVDLPDVPSAVALYDYQSSHAGDLNFKEGDRILLISQVNDEWYKGSIGASEGMFPASFIQVEVPLEHKSEHDVSSHSATSSGSYASSTSSSSSSTYRAVALYDFQPETSQDLGLQEGDIVQVTESLGNGWLLGEECRSGLRGQFPESFVQRI